jgi:hypothetical protein
VMVSLKQKEDVEGDVEGLPVGAEPIAICCAIGTSSSSSSTMRGEGKG